MAEREAILGPLNELRDRALNRRAVLSREVEKHQQDMVLAAAKLSENEAALDAINSAISKAETL